MKLISSLLLIASLTSGSSFLAKEERPEQTLKARYIIQFSKYIKWPNLAAGQEFTICTYNEPSLHQTLLPIEKNKKARYQYRVVAIGPEAQFDSCHILYINALTNEQVSSALQKVKGLPVLTISSTNGFAKRLGMIELSLWIDNRLGISINRDNASAVGLSIDSRLLQLATLVGEKS